MFYYLIEPILMYNWILILAAIVPAIFLMIKVYKSDRIEKESGYLLRRLVVAGILSTLFARIEERLGIWILSSVVSTNTVLYNVILYFGIVAIAEESSKYIMLKRNTWNNWEFNCQYDGVVYAVFVSLGFALWENINYVLSYGFSTAIVRAVTAIAIPIVLFGNRNYDDALIELRNLLEEDGFNTIAAGAFVGEHAFSYTFAYR